jgi:hypothetical protein
MKYQNTKKQCQKEIDDSGNVCDGCGGEITPIKTVDNSGNPTYWRGCEHCSVFTYGCNEKVWEIARYMVMCLSKHKYNCEYEYLNSNEQLEYWLDSETRGFARDISEILQLAKKQNISLPPLKKWIDKTIKLGYVEFIPEKEGE